MNTDGINSNNDITLSGDNDLTCNNVTTTNITATNISATNVTTNTLVIDRTSTAAVNTALGSTINVPNLLQNLNFNNATRNFEIWNDTAVGQIAKFDTSNNDVSFPNSTVTVTGALTTNRLLLNINSTNNLTVNWAFGDKQNIFLTNSLGVTFNLPLVTSSAQYGTVITIVTQLAIGVTFNAPSPYQFIDENNNNVSTKTYTNATRIFSFMAISVSGTMWRMMYAQVQNLLITDNTFSGTNQFNKGILPCTTWSTTNIQVGGLNTMANRQTTSVDNVGIGVDTLKGDANAAGYIYSTGSRNTAVGNYALMQQGSGNDCIALGFEAMQLTGLERVYSAGVSPSNCIAIGSGSQKINLYGYDNVSVGKNSLNNVGSGSNNIILGSNAGNGLGNVGSNVVIGVGAMPTSVDNGITCIGAGALGSAVGVCNSGTFIGNNAGLYNNNGNSNTFIGANAGIGNANGSQNQCLGVYAGRLSPSAGNFMTCIGYDSAAVQNNEFVIGSETFVERGELTLPNKTRLACNQTQTGVTVSLTFRTNENILLTDATTTTINLPTPNADGRSVGCKFYINRQVAGVNITINAPAGQTIALNQVGGTYTASSSYLFLAGMNSITLLCIASTGTSWQVLPTSYSQGTDNLYTSTVNPIPTTAISIPFAGTTVSGYQPYFMDNANLNYKQSTTTLTATNVTSSGTVTAGAVNISNKVNLATNQNAVSNPTLSFGTSEHVLLTDAATTAVILPVVTTANIGAKFIITRKVTGVDITINAPALTTVGYTLVDGTYSTTSTFIFSKFVSSITAISVATTGNTYMLIDAQKTVTTIDKTAAASATYYPNFTSAVSGNQGINASTDLTYNPNTTTLTSTNLYAITTSTGDMTVRAVLNVNKDFQPYETIELLSSSIVLPSLPTLYGIYYFASGGSATTITLPLITADIIGCQLNFRRITNATSALIIKTPSGSGHKIVQRASVTETAAFTNYTFLATTNFVGTLVALTTTLWSTIA